MAYLPVRYVGNPMQYVQGVGAYREVPNYSWEFFPPPYNFLAPPVVIPAPGVVAPEEAGLGDCGCGCGGACSKGVGFFDSWDLSTWGWQEWATVGILAYGAVSLMSDTKSGVRRVRKAVRRRRRVEAV